MCGTVTVWVKATRQFVDAAEISFIRRVFGFHQSQDYAFSLQKGGSKKVLSPGTFWMASNSWKTLTVIK